jgi:hypothetical protein
MVRHRRQLAKPTVMKHHHIAQCLGACVEQWHVTAHARYPWPCCSKTSTVRTLEMKRATSLRAVPGSDLFVETDKDFTAKVSCALARPPARSALPLPLPGP